MNILRSCWSPFPRGDCPVVIGHTPRLRRWIGHKPGNEMQVEVLSAFPESDGVDAIASRHRLNQTAGIPSGASPILGLNLIKGERTGTVTHSVEQQPTQKRSWFWMMAKHPEISALDLETAHVLIAMQ